MEIFLQPVRQVLLENMISTCCTFTDGLQLDPKFCTLFFPLCWRNLLQYDRPASNQVVCMADQVTGCNYVYGNNSLVVSECSGLGALTAGCSIIRRCLPPQLERNSDMMTHNWSFKAPVYTSDSFWSWRQPAVRENMHACARRHTETITHTHTHTHTDFEGEG